MIPIEHPEIPGLELDRNYIDLYLVTFHTSGAKTRSRFEKLGYTTFEATTESAFLTTPLTPIGTSRTMDEEGTLADYTVAGAAPVRSASTFESGSRQRKDLVSSLGIAASRPSWSVTYPHVLCAPARHAQVFGTTDCSVSGPSSQDAIRALFSEPTDFEGDFRFLHGVRIRDS